MSRDQDLSVISLDLMPLLAIDLAIGTSTNQQGDVKV